MTRDELVLLLELNPYLRISADDALIERVYNAHYREVRREHDLEAEEIAYGGYDG